MKPRELRASVSSPGKAVLTRDAHVRACFLVEELTENMAGEPITFCQLS